VNEFVWDGVCFVEELIGKVWGAEHMWFDGKTSGFTVMAT